MGGGERKAEGKAKILLIAFACLFIAQRAPADEPNFFNRIFFQDYETLGDTVVKYPVTSLAIAGSTLLAGWVVFANDKNIDSIMKAGHGDFLDNLLNCANYEGDGITVLAADSFLFLGGKKEKRSAQLVMESIIISGSITYLIKTLAGRVRPSGTGDPYLFKPFSFNDASMPSGHSAVAFSWATIIADAYDIGGITYPLAALCAWARVYKSAHWPSDVLIGSVIGFATAKALSIARMQELENSGGPAFAMDAAGSPVLMFNFRI